MNDQIEKILSMLVVNVSEHFGFNTQEALAAVAQSKIANELSDNGNKADLSIDQLSQKLYNEIAMAE